MREIHRKAVVITHEGAKDRLVDFPWLEEDYWIAESDWIILSSKGWRALIRDDAAVWDALERKLFIGAYIKQPLLIAVVGYPSHNLKRECDSAGSEEVRAILQRIQSLLLPASVLGFWTDDRGELQETLYPVSTDQRDVELECVH
jgi:hypothetical protein